MFFNFKFSILDSYKTSLKVNYKNILFYIAWYAITAIIGLIVLFGLAIYLDILNISDIKQGYSWVAFSLKDQLKSFFIGFKYSDIKPTEFSFYGFLQLLISKNFLNQTFETMSFKEYFNVVLLPKKIVLIPFFMVYISFLMSISIGYIKTALKFQSDKKATLHDMYQYVYLLPQYLFGKLIIFSLCFVIISLAAFIGFFVLGALPLDENSQKSFAFSGVVFGIIIVLGLLFVTFLYQRLRFIKYFIIDKEVSALKAVKLSWNLTQGSVISLFLFSLITILVGTLHPMSGLFIMISLWLNQQSEVNVYRQMVESDKKQ